MAANGLPVYNCVSNAQYTGGTCPAKDEDCYRVEVIYTRRRHGAPLLIKNRWYNMYNQIFKSNG